MKTPLTAIIAAVMLVCGMTTVSGNTRKALPGVFSVGEDKYVRFSRGNLQYNAAKGSHQCADGTTQQGTWRFAEHQWDYVGDAENGTVYADGVKCDNDLLSAMYDGWIDLFGWGTSGWNSGAKEYQPWAKSKKIADYCPGGNPDNNLTGAYAYSDWGQYNAIGTDPAGTWRTLTTEEWIYLLHERNNYDRLFGYATVNGVQGIIILPDTWELPADIIFHSCVDKGFVWEESCYQSDTEHYADNIYDSSQWNRMAGAGAVFLPCAGWRNGVSTTETLWYGDYWSVSSGEESAAYFLRFRADILNPQYGYNLYRGRNVRLVKDMSAPVTIWLSDNLTPAEYAAILDEYKDRDVNVVLQRRFNGEEWTTICLPFGLESLEGTPLDGIVYEMHDATTDDVNGITVYFRNTDVILAGRPYIVRPSEEMVNPVFNGVRLVSFEAKNVASPGGDVEFRSVTVPSLLTARTSVFLQNNRLYYPNSMTGSRIRAFRAYFEFLHPENISYVPSRICTDGTATGTQLP